MKKVFALGVTGLLMLGTASQASAYFEDGNLTMSVYDTAVQKKEMGIDLGAITDLSAQNVTLVSGLDFTGWDRTSGGIGIYAENGDTVTYQLEGWFATTSSTGITPFDDGSFTTAFDFTGKVRGAQYQYNLADANHNGIGTIPVENASGYNSNLNITSPGGYSGLNNGAVNREAKLLAPGQEYVDMYLYHFTTDADWNIVQVGSSYEAVIQLQADGDVVLNPVPVPGAIWLLGSGLAGLAGIRRRKNS